MLTSTRRAGALALTASLMLGLAACGGDEGSGDGDGSAGGMDGSAGGDGSTPGMDGSSGGDGSTTTDGGTTPTDGGVADAAWGMFPDGGCVPIMCDGHGPFQCANCIDDDGDGLTDSFDPNCLGPCDNNEEGFELKIPGSDTPNCARDCYYDGDQGSGNDGCSWDSRCDPLSPDSRAACAYEDPPPPSAKCDVDLTAMCLENCPPLVPNGCDCFGCCNIREHDDDPENWVFIGTLGADGEGTCTVDAALAGDTDACHPCTPHGDCSNPCEHCELCIGKTELPADCFSTPPPGDAGTPPADGGTPPADAGPGTDAGTPPDRCPGGEQPCGLPGDALCPSGYYCLTGCCIFFG